MTDSQETQDRIKAAQAEAEARRRRFKKNSVLTVISNFMLALAIGSVGSGIAQTFLSLDAKEAHWPDYKLEIWTVLVGVAFLAMSVIVVRMKEPEK